MFFLIVVFATFVATIGVLVNVTILSAIVELFVCFFSG
jgi:hypothetical protein